MGELGFIADLCIASYDTFFTIIAFILRCFHKCHYKGVVSYTDNQLSPTIDERSLELPYIEHTNEPELIGYDILVTLQTSSDPAKLVLDIIRNPIVPQNMGNGGVVIDGSHVFLLEQLMRISPHIKPHVKEEALKLALDLKANIREGAESSLMILGFLLLLSNYGLASDFTEDEVLKLLEFSAQHKQAVELFHTLGFVDKISGTPYLNSNLYFLVEII